MRETDGEKLFVQKLLKGQHPVYSELLNNTHPYLPKLYEVEVSGSDTTITEEYIEGSLLGNAELSEKQILVFIKELCSVLEFLHRKGIIHRDIKPSNIILAKDGHIRLLDFDAARMSKDDVEQDTRLLGTRGYAPPEQYGFSQTDSRADVYSLGVTLRQLLGEKADKPRYKRVIKKCTDPNPDRRYQSVRHVRNALPNAKRSVLTVFAVVALAVIIWQGVPYLPLNSEEPNPEATALAVLSAPENPHWEGETGIALWGNVKESGSGGSPAYSWRLYRKDTATPPSVDDSDWLMRGNMFGSGGGRGPVYAVNLASNLRENGFYYFTVSAEGDGENYTNSPFAVSDAFAYTGEFAPYLPSPTGLEWKTVEGQDGLEYYAAWSNLGDYIDTDSFDVKVYNEAGEYIGRNIWTKADIVSSGIDGVIHTRTVITEASGRYRFTVRALTSRANEYRSSPMPDPLPEEYYSPWLEITG